MKEVEEAMRWIALDIKSDCPKVTHTLFSGAELAKAMGLEKTPAQIGEFMRYLELAHCVERTNKLGPDGIYYNVHKRVFYLFSESRANKDFVREYSTPDEGFCFVITSQKTYRLGCAGRKCPFFLASEKECVQGKFFLK